MGAKGREEIPMTGRKRERERVKDSFRRILAYGALSSRQRDGEPRMPRMAFRLTQRTALSVVLARVKSSGSRESARDDEHEVQTTDGWLEIGNSRNKQNL